ncbi:MAG: MazG-like family protein [Candidatus Aenigmatarchaeota archaeon]
MKELQKRIKKFCKEHNLESPAEHRVLDTMSELGEVAKEILKMSDYGRKPLRYREELLFMFKVIMLKHLISLM